jgi:chaperonin cofactor prefoldin
MDLLIYLSEKCKSFIKDIDHIAKKIDFSKVIYKKGLLKYTSNDNSERKIDFKLLVKLIQDIPIDLEETIKIELIDTGKLVDTQTCTYKLTKKIDNNGMKTNNAATLEQVKEIITESQKQTIFILKDFVTGLFKKLEIRIENLEKRMDALEKRMDALEKRMDVMEKQMEDMDKKYATKEELKRLEDKVDNLILEVKKIKSLN